MWRESAYNGWPRADEARMSCGASASRLSVRVLRLAACTTAGVVAVAVAVVSVQAVAAARSAVATVKVIAAFASPVFATAVVRVVVPHP